MIEQDNVDSQTITIVGIFVSLLVFVLIVGVQVLYYRMQKSDEYAKFVAVAPVELKNVQTEQLSALHQYKWVDKQNGTVMIPIEQAMQQVVRRLQKSNL